VPSDQQRPPEQNRGKDQPLPAEKEPPAGPPGAKPEITAGPDAGGEPRRARDTEARDTTLRDGAPDRTPAEVVIRPTRISGTWIAVVVAAIVLIFLLIFILQNLSSVTVTILGLQASFPLGIALLFAAIAGALLVALVGTARILQLRRRVRRSDAKLLRR
jgi:uncharacterized integral membrane protein